jgi:hypothetical protein
LPLLAIRAIGHHIYTVVADIGAQEKDIKPTTLLVISSEVSNDVTSRPEEALP